MHGIAPLFCFTFAFGIFGSLLFVKRTEIAHNFFRLNSLIATVLLVAGIFLVSSKEPFTEMISLVLLFLAYSIFVPWLPNLIDRLILLLGGLGSAHLISILLSEYDPKTIWRVGDLVSTLSGGLLMGIGLVAMNIGHSYLSAEKQSMDPLRRAVRLIGALVVWRGAYLIISIPVLIALFPESSADLSRFFRMEDVSLIAIGLVRILFGIIGPFFLAIMTWETVKLESTQSATGILYALFALVLVGEASALFLTLHTGISG